MNNKKKPTFIEIHGIPELTPEQQAIAKKNMDDFWKAVMPTGEALKKFKAGLRVVPTEQQMTGKIFFQGTRRQKDFN